LRSNPSVERDGRKAARASPQAFGVTVYPHASISAIAALTSASSFFFALKAGAFKKSILFCRIQITDGVAPEHDEPGTIAFFPFSYSSGSSFRHSL